MEKLTLFGERAACCSNGCEECCRRSKCDSASNGRSSKRSALKWPALRCGALLRERPFPVAEDSAVSSPCGRNSKMLVPEISTPCGVPRRTHVGCSMKLWERWWPLFQKIQQVHSRNLPGCLQSRRPGILRVRETTERRCQIRSADFVLLRGQLKLHAA